MTQIRISSTPPGEAPLWVREQWVGLMLPYVEVREGSYFGVLGGEPEKQNIGGYKVIAQIAIEILRSKSPEAAHWWESNCSYLFSPGNYLVFGRSFCEIVA